jgi:hypothetical protein
MFHDQLFHSHCEKCNDPRRDPNGDPRVVLCASCKHLRLYHLLNCVLPTVDSAVRAIVTDLSRNQSSYCDFGRFSFHLCRTDSPGMERYKEFSLSYHRSSDTLFISELALQRRYISLCISDAVSRLHHSEASETTMHDEVYTEEINWPVLCSQLRASPDLNRKLTAVPFGLVGVRVIDVDEHCVTNLPSESEYVALSYVWGTNREEQFQLTTSNLVRLEATHSLKNEKLPRTIEDSMEMCRRVGQRYLWVDRLCIAQDARPEHKAAQLDQMYAIYHQASFTIIALAGDASYGLPGVSRPKSNRPRTLSFENFAISERVPDINWLKSDSE